MEKKESKKTAVKVVEKTQELEIQQEKNPVLQMLQMAMTDSNVDLQKMEKIMEMVERHEDKLAFKAYNRDMALMQGEIPEIQFNSVIKDYEGNVRSKYTTYEGIMKVVQPILSEFGFSVSFNPKAENNLLTVDCMISHKDGHIEKSSLSLPFDASGKKNSVQSIGSSISYAKRYALCLKLNIATGGEDNDGNTAQEPPRTLNVLTAMTQKANNKSELAILWNGLTPEEQKIVGVVISKRKIELGIVKKS
jgi:hypothetical protein